MPRYRIIKPVPNSLSFRNGTLHFEDYYRGGKEWVWYVRRDLDALSPASLKKHASTNLIVATGADGVEKARKEGFDVPSGSIAEAVVESLVRRGYAERIAGR